MIRVVMKITLKIIKLFIITVSVLFIVTVIGLYIYTLDSYGPLDQMYTEIESLDQAKFNL